MADQSQPTTADRRTVLRATAIGVAVAGVGVTAAACSSTNSIAQGSGAQTAQAQSGPHTVATSQVPVDGGFIDTANNVVVTQPSAGEYKAFTAVCTHAHCTVATVSNNVIQCPCHGSQFSAKDGSVIQGPAPSPLASMSCSVSGSTITYGA